MPNLSDAITARIFTQEEEAKAKAAAAQAEKDAPLYADLARLDRLAQNDDFRWFVETRLAPMQQKELEAALDIAKHKDVRDNAAHRWNMAVGIIGKLEEERRTLTARLYPK